MPATFRRHDLVCLTEAGRERIATLLLGEESDRALRMAKTFTAAPIPGIIRRRAPCDGLGIGIGISFPLRDKELRLRFATVVAEIEIRRTLTPYAVIDMPFSSTLKNLAALVEIKHELASWCGRLGVVGACALHIVTGLDYVHEHSDIDLVFDGGAPDDLFAAHRALCAFEKNVGIRIDAEVVVHGQVGVKLKELVSNQKTILTKGLHSVDIRGRSEVIQSLEAACKAEF